MATNLMAELGELNESELQEYNRAMQDGSGVQLPFPALNIWARNGDRKLAALAKESPVSFFGGWNIDHDKLIDLAETQSMSLPLDQIKWREVEAQGADGAYLTYETRIIHVAPISYRLSWISKDGKSRSPKYDEGHSRSHLQYLCLIGHPGDTGVKYLCPGVVTVKGKGQTEAMKNALATWRKVIDQFRRELNAQRLPMFSWWLSLGTIGDKPEFVKVGSGDQTSDITPVKAVMIPDKPDAEWLSKRFVGPANFTTAAALLKEAADWLNAWKQPASTDFTPATMTDEMEQW